MLLRWAVIFFIVAIIAGIFGFGGIAEASSDMARILFYLFIILFLVALLAGLISGRRIDSGF